VPHLQECGDGDFLLVVDALLHARREVLVAFVFQKQRRCVEIE
jgi:hypothetical protein